MGKLTTNSPSSVGYVWGVEATVIGENLAKFEGYEKSAIKADEIVRAWMNSPEHKENILKKEYNAIGISVYFLKNKICFASQEFMYAN